MNWRWINCTLSAIAVAGVALLAAPVHASEAIQVLMNQAKIVKLARPADTIVIGNPDIADASVQDATTIVLTGREFGVTNMVVLDANGIPIVDEQIVVSRHVANSVRIYRRADVQTLSCTPYCESSFRNAAELRSETEMRVRP
jgi:Flp pilus assembly secretin CpaC